MILERVDKDLTETQGRNRLNYHGALEALLRASIGAGFVVGALTIVPFFIMDKDISVLLMAPVAGLIGALLGPFLSLPAILAGAGILTFLSSRISLHCYQITLIGALLGAIYGSLLTFVFTQPFPIYLYLLGGSIAGYFCDKCADTLYYRRRHWIALAFIVGVGSVVFVPTYAAHLFRGWLVYP